LDLCNVLIWAHVSIQAKVDNLDIQLGVTCFSVVSATNEEIVEAQVAMLLKQR
jgi:hypothetical protein